MNLHEWFENAMLDESFAYLWSLTKALCEDSSTHQPSDVSLKLLYMALSRKEMEKDLAEIGACLCSRYFWNELSEPVE